jgi:S-adenosylmethionine:tRNA ribosyltransferase-isomerase
VKTTDFDYDLPAELIAQEPLSERGASRMMVVNRAQGSFTHHLVSDLPRFLSAGDLLVVNNTRVFPARVFGTKCRTGGRVELLLVEKREGDDRDGVWDAFLKSSGSPSEGEMLDLAGGQIQGEIIKKPEAGRAVVRLRSRGAVFDVLEEAGVPPLPPYIRRSGVLDSRVPADRARYQTVYASRVGAVAAPTAGLHLTEALLDQLRAKGVLRAEITLHVGPGTFKPVKADEPAAHVMEAERYEVRQEVADAVAHARAAGGRIVAVGSTTVRTLESVAVEAGGVRAGEGRSRLFIYPPYAFRVVDAMLTNFHLPRSSLIMMVSALAGRDLVLEAYREAVREHYRFYSYGDCMLIM